MVRALNAWCQQANTQNKFIKKPTSGKSNCNPIQMVMFGGYLKVRQFLYTIVVIWVNTIINPNFTKVSLLMLKVLHGI